MPKNIRDVLKRNAAQALNNSAKVILDVNTIYDEFLPVHPEMATKLGMIMIQTAQLREALVEFCKEAWYLDEEGISKYLG